MISTYRPPNSSLSDTMEDLDKIFDKIGNHSTIISGDLNICLNKKDSIQKKFLGKIFENNFEQIVESPTRYTSTSSSCIDNIITNITEAKAHVTFHSLSDHQVILCLWEKKLNKSILREAKKCNQISVKKVHYVNSMEKIKEINWSNWISEHESADINETYNSFHNIIQQSIVYETKRVNRKKVALNKWMTKEILEKKRKMEISRRKFLKRANELNETNYRKLKKEYSNDIKRAKNSYYGKQLFRAQKDGKKVWSIINELLPKKSTSEQINSITHNDKILDDAFEIAETFCHYYKHAAYNKTKDMKSDVNFETFLSNKDKRTNTFHLNPVELSDVWRAIKELKPKSSFGPDGIPTKLICNSIAFLVQPLKFIINKSFFEGTFPSLLKCSRISPIHKRDTHIPQNYRPVCQVSGFSKIIEKCVNKQLSDYSNNNFDNRNQYAYRRYHQCQDAILLVRHKIEQKLSQNHFVLVIMIDLSIAFESICTETILPKKLMHYGADAKAVSFLRSFFTGRSQYVDWKGISSNKTELFNMSCVQGSILGPQIFNTYVKDFEYVVDGANDEPEGTIDIEYCDDETSCEAVNFADDTMMIVASKDIEKVMVRGNLVLGQTRKYMDSNKLILNEKKTQYLLYKPKNKQKVEAKTKLKINNQEIQKVDSARYLGVTIDSKLNFKDHFNKVKAKLIDGVKALKCTRQTLNFQAKYQLYNGYFKSHIEYCPITYMDKLSKTQMKELYSLQKQAVRLIFNARKNVHTEKLFKLANIVPITKLYESECCKFVYKHKYDPSRNEQPIAIGELLNSEQHNSSRLYDDLNKIKIPSSYKSDHCFYQIINTWNQMDNDVKMSGNLWSLKRRLKEEQIQSLQQCDINNCNICKLDKNRNYQKYMSI